MHYTTGTFGPSVCDPSHGMKMELKFSSNRVTSVQSLVQCPDCLKKIVMLNLASSLKGLLSDRRSQHPQEVAQAFINGDLDTEAVVRLSHGENMNKVYTIMTNFKAKNLV